MLQTGENQQGLSVLDEREREPDHEMADWRTADPPLVAVTLPVKYLHMGWSWPRSQNLIEYSQK